MNAISENDHSFLTKNGINVTDIGKFTCSSCNCPINGLKNVKYHIEGYLHQHILLYKMKMSTPKDSRPDRKTTKIQDGGVLQTIIEDNSKKEISKAQNNNKTANKKEQSSTQLEKNRPISSAPTEKKWFTCTMCEIECNTKVELEHHYKGVMHYSNVAAQKDFIKQKINQKKNKVMNNESDNSKSQLANAPLIVVPKNEVKQAVPLLKPQIQPQPVKQQKRNQQSAKVMKPEEGNSSEIKATNKIQNQTKKQITNNQNDDSKSQQAEVPLTDVSTNQANQTVPLLKPQIQLQPVNEQKKIKQETKNQTQSKENPPLIQKYSEENLLFLYDILFLSSGSLNIFHPMDVQKLMENISVTFVRNDTINCVICAQQMANNANKWYKHIRSFEHKQNMESIVEHHKNFVDFSDQYSDLRLAKELMWEDSDDEINCFICATKLQNDDVEIDRHVRTTKHKTIRAQMLQTVMDIGHRLVSNVQDNWYNIEHYACQICTKYFVSEIKFFNHITSSGHKDKLQTTANCYFDFCVSCSYLCFGEENFNEKHSQGLRHEFYLRTEKYLVPKMPARVSKVIKDVEGFVKTIMKFTDEENIEIVSLVLSDLCEISQKSGGLPESEIELVQIPDCLDYTLVAKDNGSFEENSKLVDALCKTRVWQKLNSQNEIQTVRMFNTKYSFQFQIIFDSKVLVATRYLWCYLNMFKSCKPMILFLQNWLTYCNFDSNQISFFALAWFVIFYYQNVHNFPSLQEVIFPSGHSVLKNSKTPSIPSESSVSKDLKGFFEFYSTFDFKTLVLSPFLGKAVQKRDYFKSKPNEVWRLVLSVPVVLENPAVHSRLLNVTQNMTKLTLRTFRYYCAESMKHLT